MQETHRGGNNIENLCDLLSKISIVEEAILSDETSSTNESTTDTSNDNQINKGFSEEISAILSDEASDTRLAFLHTKTPLRLYVNPAVTPTKIIQ